MTQPVQEPTPQRADSALSWGERQLRRRPPLVTAGGICPTFRATIPTGDTPPDRREYPADADTLDTVFWTSWENGDASYFDPFIQPSGPDAGRLGRVDLLIAGIYLIFVRIDWDDAFAGEVRIGSNYDDSTIQTKDHETVNAWYGPDGITEMRFLDLPVFTGSQDQVEIVVGQNDPLAADHYIPGNADGYWAQEPELVVTYLCQHGLGQSS